MNPGTAFWMISILTRLSLAVSNPNGNDFHSWLYSWGIGLICAIFEACENHSLHRKAKVRK